MLRHEAKQVGQDLLPNANDVTSDDDFGRLCLKLVAKLQDSHAQLLEGTAKYLAIEVPRWDPGFACVIDDRDRPAMLLDARCISAGEGWASWFIANKRSKTFGSTTAGASSRKEEYALTNGLYKVIVPVRRIPVFSIVPSSAAGSSRMYPCGRTPGTCRRGRIRCSKRRRDSSSKS